MTVNELIAQLQAAVEADPALGNYPVAFAPVDQQRWWDHQRVNHLSRVDHRPGTDKIGVVPHLLLTSRPSRP